MGTDHVLEQLQRGLVALIQLDVTDSSRNHAASSRRTVASAPSGAYPDPNSDVVPGRPSGHGRSPFHTDHSSAVRLSSVTRVGLVAGIAAVIGSSACAMPSSGMP